MIWQFKVAAVCFILLVGLIVGGRSYASHRRIPDEAYQLIGFIIMALSSSTMISFIWGILVS